MQNYHIRKRIANVPHTEGRFSIDRDLGITDKLNNSVFCATPDDLGDDGHISVTLPIEVPFENPTPLEKLVALAFKPIHVPVDALDSINVMFADGDSGNLEPSNLLWKFPAGGVDSRSWPGYKYIPGFTRYLVNRIGDVISARHGIPLETYMANNGYLNLRITRDDDVGVIYYPHRLVALAFLDYGADVDALVVNHLDMAKTHNSVENLEWVSHLENNHHARLMRSNRSGNTKVPVEIKDIESGWVLSFSSIHEAARSFNTVPSHIWQAAKVGNDHRLFKSKYIVRYGNQPWPDLDDVLNKPNNGIPRKVLVKDVETGEIKTYEKAIDFVHESKDFLSRKQIYSHLKKGTQKQFGKIIFKYEDDPNTWVI